VNSFPDGKKNAALNPKEKKRKRSHPQYLCQAVKQKKT